MKSFVVALCLFAVAAASGQDKDAQVIHETNNINPDGTYEHGFENDNGILEHAAAVARGVGKEIVYEVTGQNQYINPEGQTIQLSYIANENGYQPQGAHLPTPPAPEPIPDYILRSLKYNLEHPYVEKKSA